jgi:hypothetical protein
LIHCTPPSTAPLKNALAVGLDVLHVFKHFTPHGEPGDLEMMPKLRITTRAENPVLAKEKVKLAPSF